ncbi:MAG: hypothetical protein LBN21_03420, partial [Treponema sp.]|nr:hypothetical protein [Treponema sp.]
MFSFLLPVYSNRYSAVGKAFHTHFSKGGVAIPNSRKNTNRKVEEVEKGRKFSYPFFNLFDFAVKFLPIFSSFGIT